MVSSKLSELTEGLSEVKDETEEGVKEEEEELMEAGSFSPQEAKSPKASKATSKRDFFMFIYLLFYYLYYAGKSILYATF